MAFDKNCKVIEFDKVDLEKTRQVLYSQPASGDRYTDKVFTQEHVYVFVPKGSVHVLFNMENGETVFVSEDYVELVQFLNDNFERM